MRIAVITGAAQGLGRETARQLSALGLHVILTGRNAASLETAAASLKNAEWRVLDVGSDASVPRMGRGWNR